MKAVTSTVPPESAVAADVAAGVLAQVPLVNQDTVTVPVGTTLESADGTQQFVVVAEAGNPLFSTGNNGFTMPAFVDTVSLPVKSLASGYATNAIAGSARHSAGRLASATWFTMRWPES